MRLNGSRTSGGSVAGQISDVDFATMSFFFGLVMFFCFLAEWRYVCVLVRRCQHDVCEEVSAEERAACITFHTVGIVFIAITNLSLIHI